MILSFLRIYHILTVSCCRSGIQPFPAVLQFFGLCIGLCQIWSQFRCSDE